MMSPPADDCVGLTAKGATEAGMALGEIGEARPYGLAQSRFAFGRDKQCDLDRAILPATYSARRSRVPLRLMTLAKKGSRSRGISRTDGA
jgi:hypothetical protein